ncbi:DREV methyltransferase [Strigomonas culicis]|uniref:DREV methyltransferase n=1 Tax=Strigomonas culicis TaxID=28005 RepID=S9V160_9TRYP|nr:DREV methyltransferase [Strigomonas culicis]EPY36847.1 DREV methyltransferase [Strigomonas culicis]|eukprot:EPY31722.1 DREV methyltransferase [Strigomonas culicis]
MRSLRKEATTFQAEARRRPVLRYQPTLAQLTPALVERFELMHCDAETAEFIEAASYINVATIALADALHFMLSRTTANGLVGRGFMFVLSTAQACQLLRPAGLAHADYRARLAPLLATPSAPAPCRIDVAETEAAPQAAAPAAPKPRGPTGADVLQLLGPDAPRFKRLLDIGAGDGGVTAKLAPMAEEVFVTEVSMSMRWRLRRRGYTVLPHENPFEEIDPATRQPRAAQYDLIALNNVLDRTDKPRTLLQDIHSALTPDGFFLLAVVLPWCPFVEAGKTQRRPTEPLPMEGGECCAGAGFEASVNRLMDNVLAPMGFELVRWTKLPYICQGNLDVAYSLLHDAVLVLRRREGAVAREEMW